MLFQTFALAADSIARALDDDRRASIAAQLLRTVETDDELAIVSTWMVHGAFGPHDPRRVSIGAVTELRAFALFSGSDADRPDTLDGELFRASRAMAGGTIETIRMHAEAVARDAGIPLIATAGPSVDDVMRFIDALSQVHRAAEKTEMLASFWRDISPAEIEWILRILSRAARHRVLTPSLFSSALSIAVAIDEGTVRLSMMLSGDAADLAVAAVRGLVAEPRPTPFQFVPPMLATTLAIDDGIGTQEAVHRLMDPGDYSAEELLEGIRAQVHVWQAGTDGSALVAIYTRSGGDVTRRVPGIAAELASLPVGTVLDGELVLLRDGQLGTVQELTRLLATESATSDLVFVAFDLLVSSGDLLLADPIETRRAKLAELASAVGLRIMRHAPCGSWRRLERTLAEASERGRRLVLKRNASPYEPGIRSGAWIKFRTSLPAIHAVVRYVRFGETPESCELTLGVWMVHPDGERRLVNICRAAAAGTAIELDELMRRLAAMRVQRYGPVWEVRPEIVCEVLYDSITASARTAAGYSLSGARLRAVHPPGASIECGTVEELSILYTSPNPVDAPLPFHVPTRAQSSPSESPRRWNDDSPGPA